MLSSILKNKCPNCLKGDFFVSNNPYNLRKLGDMHNQCSNCGMDFRQEPGFYFGAAIMSYILQVAVILIMFLLFQVMIELSMGYFISAIAAVLILISPLTFRTSRLLWINMLGTKPKTE